MLHPDYYLMYMTSYTCIQVVVFAMVMSIIAEEVYQSIRSKVVICCTKGNVSSDMQNMQYMYFGQKSNPSSPFKSCDDLFMILNQTII